MSEQINTILPAILGFVVSGLWLAYKLGIFRYLKKINDKKEILWPSFFFLTSPFIFSIAFSEAGFGKFKEIKGIDTVLTILTTAASIYTGNWFLENYRKKQKKEEIARLLVASLEEHLSYLKDIQRDLMEAALPKERFNRIDMYVARIKNDDIYKLALNQIGIFQTESIKEITRYSSGLKQLLDELKRASAQATGSPGIVGLLQRKTDSRMLDAGLCLISLNKKVIDDEESFNKFKDLVKHNYSRIKFNGEASEGITFELRDSLKNIEKLFEEFGIADELNDYYTLFKARFYEINPEAKLSKDE